MSDYVDTENGQGADLVESEAARTFQDLRRLDTVHAKLLQWNPKYDLQRGIPEFHELNEAQAIQLCRPLLVDLDILVVDDSEIFTESLVRILTQSYGATVTPATTYQKARELLQKPKIWKIILLDQELDIVPELGRARTGVELLQECIVPLNATLTARERNLLIVISSMYENLTTDIHWGYASYFAKLRKVLGEKAVSDACTKAIAGLEYDYALAKAYYEHLRERYPQQS